MDFLRLLSRFLLVFFFIGYIGLRASFSFHYRFVSKPLLSKLSSTITSSPGPSPSAELGILAPIPIYELRILLPPPILGPFE